MINRGVVRIFFGGGTPRPLKGYHAPPAGGPGAKAPRTVAKLHFFKRCKVLENESSFQKYQYFSCPKNLFYLRRNAKNWTYLTGIYEFVRKIIWQFSNFMKPINPEKFSVNSLIWLRNFQWRRKDFFRGERSGHLKTIKRPPQGVRGAKAPRTVAKFHFFKRSKVLENESSFQKSQYFSCRKNLFFLRKNAKNWTYLIGIYEFFRKIIWKFSNFMKPINPEKFSLNSLIWLRNLQWRRKEFFRGNARAT